jgi:hypothetical protein
MNDAFGRERAKMKEGASFYCLVLLTEIKSFDKKLVVLKEKLSKKLEHYDKHF